MRLISWLLLNLLFAAAAFSQTDPATLPQVEFFSPQGTVKGVRQVAACFSNPMVAFGDPRLPEPFRIDCPESGKARWADMYNWIYMILWRRVNLVRGVAAAPYTRCRRALRFELTATRCSGRCVRRWSAYAVRPAVRCSRPRCRRKGVRRNTRCEPGRCGCWRGIPWGCRFTGWKGFKRWWVCRWPMRPSGIEWSAWPMAPTRYSSSCIDLPVYDVC